jgi:C-methyltransferase C-terminal domain/Putative zinc binding domain/Methyltransferase domain
MGKIDGCGGCGSPDLERLLDMGTQPLAEGGDGRYPLRLVRCCDCLLVQLDYIVPQEQVFRPGHPYSTGNTRALRTHFRDLAETVVPYSVFGEVTAVDIGANDGTLLDALAGRYTRIAVEPTDQIKKCTKDIIRYQEFFTSALANRIVKEHGQAQLVTATNVLAHVPDVHDFLEGVRLLLADDGMFVTENHDLASITEGRQFDTVYHEHLRYYTVASLSRLLECHYLRVVSSQPVDTHGGSFRMVVRKQQGGFPGNVKAAATGLRATLYDLAGSEARAKKIYGIGATTRATPLIHYAGIADFLTCVCEVSDSDKLGKVIPGTSIPVVDEAKLIEDQPPYALLLSWHISGSIMSKLRARGYKGEFIIPLPEVRVVSE